MTRWQGSDHDLAMQEATAETVLGDFSGVSYTHVGVETRFFRDGDGFFVQTEGPTGTSDTFQVAYTFGVRPLQQYLVALPGGRLQALTVAWDVERHRWFSLYPDERIPPGDFLHWTGRAFTWNYMCADCHSTNLRKNYDLASNTYRTTFSEIDVSCEACHGPGGAHVEWAKGSERERATWPDKRLRVQLGGQEHARDQVETCAPCHSRRRIVAAGFTPGDDYLDYYAPELLDSSLYFADGQIKDEVYVYGSFLQSRMYARGVRCSDCHDPHSLELLHEGNALCNRCHTASTYDDPEHHHHPEGSSGAACVNCHMPPRTYMVVDPRRDHSFKVPRPDLTLELGTPNACTGCHPERDARWARDQMRSWYGEARRDTVPYARIIAAGHARDEAAGETLAALATHGEMPAIIRATALSLLAGLETPLAQTTLREALQDREALVRIAAARGFDAVPDDQLDALVPLLSDPVRAVRLEAARVMVRTAGHFVENVPAFSEVLDEYRASQQAVSDQPEAHLNVAVLEERLGRLDQAEQAYRTALRLDSSFIPAHVNLAMLYNQRRTAALQADRTAEAHRLGRETEALLRAALRIESEGVEVRYSLGLFLAENPERLEEAAGHLRAAARLRPDRPRLQYNAGLAYQHLGRPEDAEALLLAAHRLEPRQPDYLNALAIFYTQQKQWEKALAYLDALIEEIPDAPPALSRQRDYLLEQLNRN